MPGAPTGPPGGFQVNAPTRLPRGARPSGRGALPGSSGVAGHGLRRHPRPQGLPPRGHLRSARRVLGRDQQKGLALPAPGRPGAQSIGKINALFYRQEKYCWASELSSTRVLELESGNFRAIHRPEAPSFGASRANEGQGGGRLREMNRTESGVGLGSGHSASTTASLGRGKSCSGCGRAALRRRPVNHHPIAMCILLEDR
jgi:hypothetical protein